MRFSSAGSAISGISIFKFKCQYLQVFLLKFRGVASRDPFGENRVDTRMSDNRDGFLRLPHQVPRRDNTFHEATPRFASRRRGPEPIDSRTAGQVRPSLLHLVPGAAFPSSEVSLCQAIENRD